MNAAELPMPELFGPLWNVGMGIVNGVESSIGGITDNSPKEVGQGAAGIASGILGAGAAITDNGYLGKLSTAIGATASATTIGNLNDQMGKMQGALSNYDNAVASGNEGEIASSGLTLAGAVASVINTVGGMISSIADVAAAGGLGGEIGAGALEGLSGIALGLGALGGLLGLATAASASVIDAIKSAAQQLGSLMQQNNSGQGGDHPNNPDGSQDQIPPTGAGSSAMGKYNNGNYQISPLVLDLTGTGINLTPLTYNSPYFDLTNDGFARQTGWVGSGMGILCFDPDDRNITNITQLFGNATTDGFDLLRVLDANHDNVINASDPVFNSLRVWVDANGDGITEPGELYTLSQLGIVSINLNATQVDQTIAGNRISSISSYTLADGTTREIADAWFTNSSMDTRSIVQVDVSPDASILPQLTGYGTLRDLRSAMTLDTTLLDLVKQFHILPTSTTVASLESSVTAIMYEWAGVSNVGPNSRGGAIDARQLEFVESYLGVSFNSASDGKDPQFRAAADIHSGWNNLFDATLARLVLQSPNLASLVPEFKFDAATDTIQASSSLAPAISAAFERLGDITKTNLSSWELLLRVADAARLDMGFSESLFEQFVEAATNRTVASIANAIAYGLQVGVDASGRIEETGSAINDVLYAGSGIGLLIGGGGGNNAAAQLSSNDIFMYSAGDGALEIDEADVNAVAPTNTLQFGRGISGTSIFAKVSGTNVVITDGIAGDQITLDREGLKSGLNGVQLINFADGTSWSWQQLLRACTLGTTGDDKLYGVLGGDVFDGKGGNDYASGVGGGDTFIFNAGYGKLEISESDSSSNPHNVLKLGGISASSVTVRSTGNNLILTDGTIGDQITLDAALSSNAWGVQTVQFDDGSSWTRQQLLQMEMTGTPGNETLWGTSGADIIDGKGGNDVAYGGGGGDTFIFNAGYGKLEISESDSSSNPHNVLKLGGISASSVTVRSAGNNLILTDGTVGDQITLDAALSSNAWGVQTVQFDDVSTWTRQQMLAMASGQLSTASPQDTSHPYVSAQQTNVIINDTDRAEASLMLGNSLLQLIQSMASVTDVRTGCNLNDAYSSPTTEALLPMATNDGVQYSSIRPA